MDKLSADYLTQLNFNRSKKWAAFLKNISLSEGANEIINLAENDHEKIYKDDDDDSNDNNDLSYMEDSEDESHNNVLEDITNCSRMIMTLSGGNGGKYINEVTIQADHEFVNDLAKQELIDLLNHTLPIINEYKRQMKETGLENVLNTFDAKKIEQTEGDWYKNKTLMMSTQNIHNIKKNNDHSRLDIYKNNDGQSMLVLDNQNNASGNGNGSGYLTKKINNKYCNDEFSSDESLHSCDLARYVRSTKHYTSQGNSLKKIKTFCTVKGKRDELRQKYACYPGYDDDEIYLTAVRHRRKHFSFNDAHQDYHHHRHCHYQSNDCNLNKLKTRKKILRKRPPMSYKNCTDSTNGTESDEDNVACSRHNECVKICHCRFCHNENHNNNHNNNNNNRKLMKRSCERYTAKNQIALSLLCEKMKTDKKPIRKYPRKHQFYSSSVSLSSSSSSPSIFKNRICNEKKIYTKFHREFISDPRAYKRESECQCHNDGKLCSIYKHLAETSNDEWIVENYFATKEMPTSSASSTTATQVLTSPLPNSLAATSTIVNCGITKSIKEKPTTTPRSAAASATKRQSETTSEEIQPIKIKKSRNKKILPTKQQQQQQQESQRKNGNGNSNILETDNESEFESQLQMAITESLKLYTQQQNSKPDLYQQPSSTTIQTPTMIANASHQNNSQDKLIKTRRRLKRHNNDNEHKYQNNDNVIDDDAYTENDIVKKIPKLQQLTKQEHSSIQKSNVEVKNNKRNSNLISNGNDEKDFSEIKEENTLIVKPTPKLLLANMTVHKNDGWENIENLSYSRMQNLTSKKSEVEVDAMTVTEAEAKAEAKADADKTELFNYYTPGIHHSTAIATTTTKSINKAKVKTKTPPMSLTKVQLNRILSEEQFNEDKKSSKRTNGEDKNQTNDYNRTLSTTTSVLIKNKQKKNSCSRFLVTSSSSSLDTVSAVSAKATARAIVSNSTLQSANLKSTVKSHYNYNNNDDGTDNDNDNINDVVSSTTQLEISEIATAETIAPASTSASATATTNAMTFELGSLKVANGNTLGKVKECNKGIVIYRPAWKDQLAPNGYFEVTKDYLRTVIGMEATKKFFKYYVGRRRFHYTSTVYFRSSVTDATTNDCRRLPNKRNQNDDDHGDNGDCNEDSTDDDNDVLECCNQYGYLYELIQSDD